VNFEKNYTPPCNKFVIQIHLSFGNNITKEETMDYVRISERMTGFTNQIILLASAIVSAANHRSNVVVVQAFLDNIHTSNYSPISQILNLEATNVFLKEQYNLIVADRSNVVFELVSVFYGNPSSFFDVTDFIKAKCLRNNRLGISKQLDFNLIRGDPCVGTPKTILIHYKVNGHLFTRNFLAANRKGDITLNMDGPYKLPIQYPLDISFPAYDPIIKSLVFNPTILQYANQVISRIDASKKINVIHLRMEPDAISHWSKQNRITEAAFEQSLQQNYIDFITQYISPEEETIVLSASLSNGVIDFLEKNHYRYRFVDKFFQGREKNAIVDLLVSRMCNNVFLGNGGSTFSMYVSKMMAEPCRTTLYINLNNLKEAPIVVKR
jgi:hypothetical protein